MTNEAYEGASSLDQSTWINHLYIRAPSILHFVSNQHASLMCRVLHVWMVRMSESCYVHRMRLLLCCE